MQSFFVLCKLLLVLIFGASRTMPGMPQYTLVAQYTSSAKSDVNDAPKIIVKSLSNDHMLGQVVQPHWSEVTRNLAPFASVTVAIVALVLVLRQIRQSHRTYRERSYGDLYSQQQSITQQFIDRPYLRPYFYANHPCSEVEHQAACEIVAEQFCDLFEFIWLVLPTLPEDVQDGWVHFMQHIYTNSDALRDYVEKRVNWYDPDMLDRIGYKRAPSGSNSTTQTGLTSQ